MELLQAKSSQLKLDWTQNSPSNTQPEVIHQYSVTDLFASRESWQQSVKQIQASFSNTSK